MVYILRILLTIVRHHDHRLVLSLTKHFNDILHQPPVFQVQPMKRLIENQQRRVFHKRTSQQHQPLFSTAQF